VGTHEKGWAKELLQHQVGLSEQLVPEISQCVEDYHTNAALQQ